MRKLSHEEILNIRLTVEQSKSVKRHPVSAMLIDVRSLYNVGSIFRTSDSALIEELILCGFTPHPPRKEIEKTALGAVDSVPHKYIKNSYEAISEERNKGKKIIAVEITDNKRICDSLDINDFPVCFVFGNELTGLDNKIIESCDDAIEIPMFGVKHSLNVSVSVGIVLFEAVKIWKKLNL